MISIKLETEDFNLVIDALNYQQAQLARIAKEVHLQGSLQNNQQSAVNPPGDQLPLDTPKP
ncbi:hypothetical protein [Polynucleobacter sp. UK-Kesae-W10]|uniref:hypothetical protein n=1 Tax=Polynucleobacter sp. UK-Kesae-W10 TaxID=1819738 RepID=UPI001C0D981B|nr:hypothetical protein [Polynucleobacter sp. UK-Kesae-W10]MBU3577593.1 hypothetical protein [Polynucleobacter sp. UK-Kesae-W10]